MNKQSKAETTHVIVHSNEVEPLRGPILLDPSTELVLSSAEGFGMTTLIRKGHHGFNAVLSFRTQVRNLLK